MRWFKYVLIFILLNFFVGCISPDNKTVTGGTPNVTRCSPIDGVLDGADFVPKGVIKNHKDDNRTHPDIFYIAWADLDKRNDLRFPSNGYDDTGFEDKLLVSRKQENGDYKTWQIYPALDNDCKDVEKVRIQSFDVAPDGKHLYVAMSKPVFADGDTNKATDLNPNRHLGIFKLNIQSKKAVPITHNWEIDYMYPNYIGDDNRTGNEKLLITKTVTKDEIPINYRSEVLKDEYDRAPTPLIHILDTSTGDLNRIGFNNSHQTEPMVANGPDGYPLIMFTQWEHQQNLDRFSIWKIQVDGSDAFLLHGNEAVVGDSIDNVYQVRTIKSGKYKDYLIMGESARSGNEGNKIAEGNILMTLKVNLDLRSKNIYLSKLTKNQNGYQGVEYSIARSPEYYNDESFIYSWRETVDNSYGLYIKDFPKDLNTTIDLHTDSGKLVISNDNYHFVQARSFYLPNSRVSAPDKALDLSENRVSFTNDSLGGRSGWLVETLTQSDNGDQNQLDGIDKDDIRIQFHIPSHHFDNSQAISPEHSPELTIPASDFIATESDGSLGIILKEGLYVWKIYKKFRHIDTNNITNNIWVPIRAERQEVSFVPNRVNACNQCHQDRNQYNIDLYKNMANMANQKMHEDLNANGMIGSDKDISDYNSSAQIPDFHKQIAPLFIKSAVNGGGSCVSCHNVKDKLNLSNQTGVSSINATYLTLLYGAHKVQNSEEVIPYLSNSIAPLGLDNHPAPFLWSLILNDDLTIPPDENHTNNIGRSLERDGDYGAEYNITVKDEIDRINALYDHSKHWSSEDIQALITYSTMRTSVGLSDKITFQKNSISRTTGQAQKAYQAMVRKCFNCHNSFENGGLKDESFGLPKEKRFKAPHLLKDDDIRFVMRPHIATKDATKYSHLLWQSNLTYSMERSLESAKNRINFNDLNNSELLVYARGGIDLDGNGSFHNNIKNHPALDISDGDYIAISNWVNGVNMINQTPTISYDGGGQIEIKEYDEPAFLPNSITWNDPDGENEIAQLFITKNNLTEHNFNDTMLALDYQSFKEAKLKTYAILGDRGDKNFEFTVSDGIKSLSQNLAVRVTSDYIVPRPTANLPKSTLFYTVRETKELRKLEAGENNESNDTLIGTIEGYNNNWSTVYRRADKGWLYFVEQTTQKIHVVDETNASELFTINLDHEPNRDSSTHKQTVYLIWWRPAEGNVSDGTYKAGELQGILESKLSKYKTGDFYVGLGSGELNSTNPDLNVTVVPEYRTKLRRGGNTISAYVWRRATFMTEWNNEDMGYDGLNVLNLVTGKAKLLSTFQFEDKSVDSVDYNATTYSNVRAVVLASDGAFYGFNKDLNQPVQTFNFDPIENIQTPVTIPAWLQTYMSRDLNSTTKATPFLIIEPKN